jgi:hypothetical protein
MGYKLKYTRQVDKDARLLEQAGLDENGELYKGIVKVISMWTHYE